MTIRMAIAVAAGLGAVVMLGSGAGAEMLAPTKAPKTKTVNFLGCATRGVPEFCVMIKGPGGANYNVSDANPGVPIGRRVRLTGTVTDKMSPCFGTVLDNVRWRPVPGVCTLAKGTK